MLPARKGATSYKVIEILSFDKVSIYQVSSYRKQKKVRNSV